MKREAHGIPSDVYCSACGSFEIEHVDISGQPKNRCRDCGHLDVYVPSQAAIERECRNLRAHAKEEEPYKCQGHNSARYQWCEDCRRMVEKPCLKCRLERLGPDERNRRRMRFRNPTLRARSQLPLAAIGLATRIVNALDPYYRDAGELAAASDAELSRPVSIGPKAIQQIDAVLSRLGFPARERKNEPLQRGSK